MKKKLYVLAAVVMAFAMILTACGAKVTEAPVVPPVVTEKPPVVVVTEAPPVAPTCTEVVQVRWFIGMGTGSDPAQVSIEQEVVDDFNAANPCIRLGLEIIPNASAPDTLATEIAAGAAPDIIGPVGWIGSGQFYGQYLDIAPFIASTGYDTSKFEAALVSMYQAEDGLTGLPFAVYPSAIFFNTGLFAEAGLNPLPAAYGDKYVMPDGTSVDWTWDALGTVAKLLTIDSEGVSSGQAGFDKTKIVQYGFSWSWENKPSYWGAFWAPGQFLVPGGAAGSYAAQVPAAWSEAWQWYYDGMWGDEPFVPNGAVAGGAEFGSGNVFSSNKVGMVELPSWYLCCVGDLEKAGGTFDFGAMPSYNGVVSGRVDADTFRIWKGTAHPDEAFAALAYLIDTGIQKLVVGTPDRAPAYGAIPSQSALRGPWLEAAKAAHPSVTNWDVLLAGLNYPDVPSAEAYMPNLNEAWARTVTFSSLLESEGGVDLAAAETQLVTDLGVIFNK